MNSIPDPEKLSAEKSLQWTFPFSEKEWADTCSPVKTFLLLLVETNAALQKRVEELEKRLNKNSSNSDRPPSSDNPYKNKDKKDKAPKKKK